MYPAAIHMPIAASTLLVSGRGIYYGLVADETASAAASFTLYDGVDTNGLPIDYVRLAALGNVHPWYGSQGIRFEQGLYIGAITGTVRGQIYFVAQTIVSSAILITESGSDRRARAYLTEVQIDDALGASHYGEESY